MKFIKLILLGVIFLGIESCQEQSGNKIKWDFTKKKTLTYDYHETTKIPIEDALPRTTETNGTLIISAKGNGKADVFFKDLRTTFYSISRNNDTSEIITQMIPDIIMLELNEFGIFENPPDKRIEMLSRVLFTTPIERIATGDINNQPITIPFDIFHTRVIASGINQIKLESVTDSIAYIRSVFDVSKYETPEFFNTNQTMYVEGESNYTYDFSNKCINSQNIDITLGVKTDFKNYTDESKDVEHNTKIRLTLIQENLSQHSNITLYTLL